jgi:hypothetical protein
MTTGSCRIFDGILSLCFTALYLGRHFQLAFYEHPPEGEQVFRGSSEPSWKQFLGIKEPHNYIADGRLTTPCYGRQSCRCKNCYVSRSLSPILLWPYSAYVRIGFA